jgi:hypothetical protein
LRKFDELDGRSFPGCLPVRQHVDDFRSGAKGYVEVAGGEVEKNGRRGEDEDEDEEGQDRADEGSQKTLLVVGALLADVPVRLRRVRRGGQGEEREKRAAHHALIVPQASSKHPSASGRIHAAFAPS